MTTQHTPGAWKVGSKYKNDIVCNSTHLTIARAMLQNEEYEANARLIAAAPELLEALIELANECDIVSGDAQAAILKARAVIAKATGDTA